MATRGRHSAIRVLAAGALVAVLLPASPTVDRSATASAAVPPGFTESVLFSGLVNPTAVRFSPDGRVFVAEKSGLIKVFASLTSATPTVVADLRTKVHNYWDRGLLGMALSPTFPTDPSIYVLYTYDHMLGSSSNPPTWGQIDGTSDPCPNPPGATIAGCVVSGRLSRLDLSGNTWVGPEHVLIEDWCQQFPSHSVGSIAFGQDGMLYASAGDGASFNYVDYGQSGDPLNPCGDPPAPVGGAQTPPGAEGGALRAQAVRGSAPPSAGPYDQIVLADSPVAYWRLGESGGTTAADQVGANPGLYATSVTLGTAGAIAGEPNTAVRLDGTTGRVTVADSPSLHLAAAGNLTIETWFKRSRIGAWELLVDKGWQSWGLGFNNTDYLKLSSYGFGDLARSNQRVTDTNWHHAVATRSGTTSKIYLDGVDVTLPVSNLTWSDASAIDLHIGSGNNSDYFQGDIDEVAIYDRALSQNEVAEHFQAGRDGAPSGAPPKTLDGSIVRIDPVTGAAAPGNPYASSTDPNMRRVIANGMRNPFRIAFRPGTNELWVGDVGWNTFEEINVIPRGDDTAAENFGWPCYEGSGRQPGYDAANLSLCENLYSQGASAVNAPRYAYNHSDRVVANELCPSGSSSISGLAFYPETGGSFPAAYRGGLFFSDYSRNCIWFMAKGSNGLPDPANIQTFVSSAAGPVDVVIGAGGDLFYPDFNGGTIRRVRPTGAPQTPTARIVATPTSGTAPLTVQFDGSTSTDPGNLALTYAWDLDGDGALDDSTAVAPSWQYTQAGSVTVTLQVTNTASATGTATQQISVGTAVNQPPTPTILTPTTGTTWAVGDILAYSGSATDPEDGQLTAARLSWRFVMHHCPSNCHTHDIETVPGVASGTFVAPDHEYPSFLEIVLTATDSAGSSASTSINLDPKTVTLTFQSAPPGLQLVFGSAAGTAPFIRTVIQGSTNSMSAPSPQVVGGTTYTFASWSDGGAATHVVTAGTANTSYTATFTGSTPPSADVSVTKTGAAGANKSVRFTMVVRNNGPSSAAGVSLSDVLPGGTSFTAVSSTAGTCSYNSGTKSIACSIGTLASGSTATVTLDLTVNGKPKSIANTATASSTATDPNTANNSSTVNVALK